MIDNWPLQFTLTTQTKWQFCPENFSNSRRFLSSLFSKINLSLLSQNFSNRSSLSLSVSSPLKIKSQNFPKFLELKFSLSNTLPFTCDCYRTASTAVVPLPWTLFWFWTLQSTAPPLVPKTFQTVRTDFSLPFSISYMFGSWENKERQKRER